MHNPWTLCLLRRRWREVSQQTLTHGSRVPCRAAYHTNSFSHLPTPAPLLSSPSPPLLCDVVSHVLLPPPNRAPRILFHVHAPLLGELLLSFLPSPMLFYSSLLIRLSPHLSISFHLSSARLPTHL